MIMDRIGNSSLYYAIHPGIQCAFAFIQKTDLSIMPVGRTEIDGANLYAIFQDYITKPIEKGLWEAHRRYIDLQYMVQGAEKIGYANIANLRQGSYDPSKDFLPLQGVGDFLTLHQGYFALLLPEDGHMPGLAVDAPMPVKKLVIKIAVHQD
jgi:YhcH/YjgK/YiaL family protein